MAVATKRIPLWGPYAVMLLLVGVLSYTKPKHNWDLVEYVAAASAGGNFEEIHRLTFAAVRTEVAREHFVEITTANEFRKDLYRNPAHLGEVMAFYSVKPLFIAAIRGLHLAGIPLVHAAMLVPILSYLFLGWVLWKWVGWPAYLMMIGPPILGLVRLITPDALALAVSAAALYLICERGLLAVGTALLLLCIWCRPDTVIFAGFIFLALWAVHKINLGAFCLLSMLALVSYWAISHFSGNPGWSALFESSFIRPIVAPLDQTSYITPRLYAVTALRNLVGLESESALFIFVLLGAIAIRLHRSAIYRAITWATFPAIVAHYLGFPTLEMRFFAPMFLFQLTALISSLGPFAAGCSGEGQPSATLIKT
jgi:hypothetical protein